MLQRQTLGSEPGARLSRVGADTAACWVSQPLGPMQARIDGFDLHARLAIATQAAGGKRRLEDLVRYCARPPLSHDRVTMLDNGQISLELKTPWRDGTTHVVHDPLDFIAKLAALIPRPHRNLVFYRGVLAARSKATRKRCEL